METLNPALGFTPVQYCCQSLSNIECVNVILDEVQVHRSQGPDKCTYGCQT